MKKSSKTKNPHECKLDSYGIEPHEHSHSGKDKPSCCGNKSNKKDFLFQLGI